MNDFARRNQGDDGSGFNGSGARGAPIGVEGFVMFGDGNANAGGYPQPGPRY
jgi:hypothetical protein